MAKEYQWKADTGIVSGGYPNEEYGVDPNDTSWHTTSALSGSTSRYYFYRDSSTSQNSNSSKVRVYIDESWTASIDSRNNLTIVLTTTISQIVRGEINGNPWTSPYARNRNIYIRRSQGGSNVWSIGNDPIDSAHTILASPGVTLSTYTFTLAPGEGLTRSSLYYISTVPGHESDPLPNIYTDVFTMGTTFKNILPADYRPGAILKSAQQYEPNPSDGAYYSHNRSAGACHILATDGGSTWTEMRTIGAPTDMGDPPAVLHDDKWYNQLLIGKE